MERSFRRSWGHFALSFIDREKDWKSRRIKSLVSVFIRFFDERLYFIDLCEGPRWRGNLVMSRQFKRRHVTLVIWN